VLHGAGHITAIPATGLPIALYPGQPYAEAIVPVGQADVLFFYTDGLVEAENEREEMFGIDRLQSLLASAQERGIDQILQNVDEAVKAFRGHAEPLDDATMMVLRVDG